MNRVSKKSLLIGCFVSLLASCQRVVLTDYQKTACDQMSLRHGYFTSLFDDAKIIKPHKYCPELIDGHGRLRIVTFDISSNFDEFDGYWNSGFDSQATEIYEHYYCQDVEPLFDSDCCGEFAHEVFDDMQNPFETHRWLLFSSNTSTESLLAYVKDGDNNLFLEKWIYRCLIAFLEENTMNLITIWNVL